MNNFNLDNPLLEFSGKTGNSFFTIRDAVQGTQIFGGIGSGKTSGSGRILALKYLENGFGGLVLTAKQEEKAMWQDYCLLTNRLNDLIVIAPGSPHSFNFLEYESSHKKGGSITKNIVEVLKTVIRASQEKNSQKSDDSFWEKALDMLIYNVIDLCSLSYGKISVQKMFDIVVAAPKKIENKEKPPQKDARKNAFEMAFEAAQNKLILQIKEWEKTPAGKAAAETEDPAIFEYEILNAIPDTKVLRSIDQFFVENYKNLNDKTRSIIEFIFTGFLFHLLKEPFYSLFCRNASTITPDDCLQGKIILLDLPVKQYEAVGRDSQVMFKYIFQRAMERRNVSVNDRPVFLWADEAQHFLHEHDSEYQATARSSRICTVYISQNLPNYLANMSGDKSEHRVMSFLGTLGTKIFHANADLETNKYGSALIGQAYTEDNSSSSSMGEKPSFSRGKSFKLESMVRPEEFVRLKTGGPRNNFCVEGIVHRQGEPFPNGLNHKKVSFSQEY